MTIVFFLIFFAFFDMDLFDEFDFSEFTKTISLSEVLFETSMNDALWDSTEAAIQRCF